MKRRWKVLIMTPYIVMLAIALKYSSMEYEIYIVILYTIVLVISLTVRWIIWMRKAFPLGWCTNKEQRNMNDRRE